MSVSKIKKLDEKQRKNKGLTSAISLLTSENMENISLVSQMLFRKVYRGKTKFSEYTRYFKWMMMLINQSINYNCNFVLISRSLKNRNRH